MANYRTIALTVSTAVFMQFFDATALNTALPAISRDLRAPPVDLNVAILAYQLALAAFIPIGNIAVDRIGARNAFVSSLAVFLSGSLLCASSRSLPALVAARAFQGLGGAVMMPVSRQMVVRSAEKHELISAMNWLLIPGIVGPLIGPALGGLIVTYASWHWIFLINLPVALIGILLTFLLVPNDAVRTSERIDFKGVGLIAVTVACLVFGLEQLSHPGATRIALILLVAGLSAGCIYIRHARGNPAASIDLTLLAIPSFRHSMVAGTLLRTLFGATGFLFPLWFQLGMGLNAAHAGLLLIATPLGAIASRFVGTPLIERAHPWHVAMAGAIFVVLALLTFSAAGSVMPDYLIALLLFLQGIGVSIALMIVSAVSYVDVAPERLGAAIGFYTTVQQINLSLGVTVGVWAIGAMHWLLSCGPHDGVTYRGSTLILCLLAVAAIYATSRLSHESLATLRKRRIEV